MQKYYTAKLFLHPPWNVIAHAFNESRCIVHRNVLTTLDLGDYCTNYRMAERGFASRTHEGQYWSHCDCVSWNVSVQLLLQDSYYFGYEGCSTWYYNLYCPSRDVLKPAPHSSIVQFEVVVLESPPYYDDTSPRIVPPPPSRPGTFLDWTRPERKQNFSNNRLQLVFIKSIVHASKQWSTIIL